MSVCFPRASGLYVRRGRCPTRSREPALQSERLWPRTGCGVEERRPLTRDMAARGRTSSAARHVSGCRWAPVRRVWFTSPHTGRCTKPLPRQPPSAPGLCRRAASRTLPSSAMSGRGMRRGPTWSMYPDGASEAGRRNRSEARRLWIARRRTSRHGVRQAQAFHVKHTSCTTSLQKSVPRPSRNQGWTSGL